MSVVIGRTKISEPPNVIGRRPEPVKQVVHVAGPPEVFEPGMDSLTVCITNFKRAEHLRRALQSCRDAGVTKIVVFSMAPDGEVFDAVKAFPEAEHCTLRADLGCNELWLQAAYHARTKHILILHDDDFLAKEFGAVFLSTIKPALESKEAGFASWRGHAFHYDTGRIRPLEYREGPTRLLPSMELETFVARPGRLSLSPIVSVFDRATLIEAVKESHEKLPYLHPGMVLGTEILVYLRHCAKYRRWLYVHEVLSFYGTHEGSGTTAAEQSGLEPLIKGYDETRRYFTMHRSKPLDCPPRFLLCSSAFKPASADEQSRIRDAFYTWDFHFNLGTMLNFPLTAKDLPRSSVDIGDPRALLYLRDVLDFGCAQAMPEDVVMYANLDVAFTVDLPDRIKACLAQSGGVCTIYRRTMKYDSDRPYQTVRGGVLDGGIDVIAVTPAWWRENRLKLPDMFVSAAHWDFVFRVYAEKLTQGKNYLYDGVYHYPHVGLLKRIGNEPPVMRHNQREAKEFFRRVGKPHFADAV